MKTSILFFIFSLSLASISFSQTYSVTNYSLEDGLVQSQIRSIGEDKDGYLWFGSYTSGASRFNGANFETFSIDNGLCASSVHVLLADKNKNLWFGSYGDGICVYDGKEFKQYGEEDGLAGKKIYSMLEDAKGRLFFGTDSGVVIFNNEKFKSLHVEYPEFKFDIVRSIVEGKNGEIYFGGSRHGVAILKDNHLRYLDSKGEKLSIFSLLYDSKDNLWIGTRKGIYKSDGKSFHYISKGHISSEGITRCLYEDEDGIIWVGSTKGLFQYRNKKLKEIFFSGITEQIFAQKFYIDREGNFWVASQNVGVFMVKKPVFTNYSVLNGIAHNYVFAIQKYNDEYWLGGYKGGLSILHNDSIRIIDESDGLKNNRTFSFAIDKKTNELIIGTAKGISVYKDGEFIDYPIFDKLNGIKIYDLYFDSENKLWACTADHGLSVFIDKDSSYTYSTKNGLSNNRVFSIAEDNEHNLWIATNAGIQKIDADNNITLYNEENGLLDDRCIDIVVDKKNNLWIAHNKGLSHFDGKSFQTFNTTNGLSSSSIFLLKIDSKGDLWLGNNKALDRVDLDLFYSKDIFSVKTYNKSIGYIGIEANQKASFVDGNKIWFGSINGVSIFNPQEEIVNPSKPTMHITGLNLFFDQPLSLDSNVILDYTQNHLTFNFIGLSFYSPEGTRYSYFLEGADEKWSPPSDKTSATFANLTSGEYTFMVKACNEDGVWSKPETYFFTITPPFWKTTWFIILCVLFAGLLIYMFISYRTKKLKRDKQLLEKEVLNRTHELNDANILIEQKNKDITDSINYAKRIQSALLPDITKLTKSFKSYFYFYKPKDIVSGDFYWYHDFGDVVICAVGDCTGHGVPGALMSMICISQINQHVKSQSVSSPAKALNLINDGIVETLKQQKTNIDSNDGMDIAMCAFHKKEQILHYSGAFRPLYIVRRGELIEYSPNRFSLGGQIVNESEYKGHEIQLETNDCVYMFSDGYADQFGGPKGKKFMTRKFKRLLISINNKTLDEQKEILHSTFYDWKQDNEQVDDILVMGFRV